MLGVSAYTQYYFDEDICIIVISNTESLDQYRFGNGIAAILHNKQAPVSYKPEDSFKRRCEEQQTIYKLISEGNIKPSVWGYELISKQFI